MNTCEYDGDEFPIQRSHPWTDTTGNPNFKYYDLVRSPEHIRNSMEDFKPFEHYPAIELFYRLLTDLNQYHSGIETNDCAFEAPHKNQNAAFSKSQQCSGRVMVLFRKLEHNTVNGNIEWLTLELHKYLATLDKSFRWGTIGTTVVPVRYLALGKHEFQQRGEQLMISFWAWGNSEKEIMSNFERLMKNLSAALRHLSSLVTNG